MSNNRHTDALKTMALITLPTRLCSHKQFLSEHLISEVEVVLQAKQFL
jgi:hypothetical protein